MTEQNCSLNAPQALPISTHSLVDFDQLTILRRKVLESIFIAPPPEYKTHGPGGALFKHPIQVVVLGIYGDEIKLGVYAHPHLTLEQGSEPNASWRQRWEAEWDHPTRKLATPGKSSVPQMPSETNLAFIEDNTNDELDALAEAHYFFYQMIEALFDSEGTRTSTNWRLAKSGFSQWKDWLLMRESRVRRLANEDYARATQNSSQRHEGD